MLNIGKMMKQVQAVQSKMAEMQERLADLEITGSAGGGMVEVTLNGKSEMRRVKIDPALVNPAEVEVLEDLIVAASNEAKAKVEAKVQEEMQSVTGGLDLPPGFQMPT